MGVEQQQYGTYPNPNQTYPNYNQANSDNRLYNQPNYQPQPQQPYYQGQPIQQPPPNVVYVQGQNNTHGQYCPVCNQNTNSYVKRDIGNITWIWCIVLLFFTGICCWIPFVCDSCKQEQVKCQKCHAKKTTL